MNFNKELVDEELKIYKISCKFGHISVMEEAQFSPADNSVSEFIVNEGFRGNGFGDLLLKEAMEQYSNLGAQVSSLASLKVFYNNGYRLFDKEDIPFEEVKEKFLENGGSIFMNDTREDKPKITNRKRLKP